MKQVTKNHADTILDAVFTPLDAVSSPATSYAEWRARADIRLADLRRLYWHHRNETSRLAEEIHELEHVMGNGKSGGTAWTLHNSK